METPQQQTRMAQEPKTTKMVQPKKEWIRAIRPIRLADQTHLSENMVAEVTEKEAREFADKKFDNAYPFSGERQSQASDAQKGTIVRAVRISEEEFKASKKTLAEDDDDSA